MMLIFFLIFRYLAIIGCVGIDQRLMFGLSAYSADLVFDVQFGPAIRKVKILHFTVEYKLI
jgi:hypothetical protein